MRLLISLIVLLEAPFDPIRRQMNSVLLTVDLTKAVADEAIERKDCVVVAYRMCDCLVLSKSEANAKIMFSLDPIIFKGLKSLTLADTQQQSLLRLALEGISVHIATTSSEIHTLIQWSQVYSPHTAVDAAPGGLGDWLADIVTGTLTEPEPETKTAKPERKEPESLETDSSDGKPAESESDDPFIAKKPSRPFALQRGSTYSKPTYPAPIELEATDLHAFVHTFNFTVTHMLKFRYSATAGHKRCVITPVEGVEGWLHVPSLPSVMPR